MFIIQTKDFDKELNKLPKEIKRYFEKQKVVFRDNWIDLRLHTKRLKDLPGIYSFRITRRYRALFYFQESDRVIFFSIGHRKEIYKDF